MLAALLPVALAFGIFVLTLRIKRPASASERLRPTGCSGQA